MDPAVIPTPLAPTSKRLNPQPSGSKNAILFSFSILELPNWRKQWTQKMLLCINFKVTDFCLFFLNDLKATICKDRHIFLILNRWAVEWMKKRLKPKLDIYRKKKAIYSFLFLNLFSFLSNYHLWSFFFGLSSSSLPLLSFLRNFIFKNKIL